MNCVKDVNLVFIVPAPGFFILVILLVLDMDHSLDRDLVFKGFNLVFNEDFEVFELMVKLEVIFH